MSKLSQQISVKLLTELDGFNDETQLGHLSVAKQESGGFHITFTDQYDSELRTTNYVIDERGQALSSYSIISVSGFEIHTQQPETTVETLLGEAQDSTAHDEKILKVIEPYLENSLSNYPYNLSEKQKQDLLSMLIGEYKSNLNLLDKKDLQGYERDANIKMRIIIAQYFSSLTQEDLPRGIEAKAYLKKTGIEEFPHEKRKTRRPRHVSDTEPIWDR